MIYRETRIAVQYDGADRSWQRGFHRRRFLSFAAGIFGSSFVQSAALKSTLAAAPDGPLSFLAEARAVEDGQTLLLVDGRRVRLPEILPPGPDRHAPMADTGPLRQAATALADLVLGHELRIDLEDPGQDRYGRLRARVSIEGQDVAESLCRLGWVRVFPETGAAPDRVQTLIAAEDRARAAPSGFWREGFFRETLAEPYDGARDRFEIVTGVVTEVKKIGRRLHLGFGPDWREDFTAGIPNRLVRRIAETGLDFENLIGNPVEVRGWVRHWNGPFLEVSDVSAIRLR